MAPFAKDLPITLTAKECDGRTFIVTGANSGLGLECTKHLVQLGSARVIMAVRNMQRGEEAKAMIEDSTGRKDVLQLWTLDMASYASVKAFVARVEGELDRVDCLIANAGISNGKWQESEGLELNILVNLVATLLLVLLMLPHLEKSAKHLGIMPHVSIIGSVGAFYAQSSLNKVDRNNIFKDLNDRQKSESDINTRYILAKLMLHFAVRQLASLAPVSKKSVIINLGNPGLCKTGLVKNTSRLSRIVAVAMHLFAGRTAEMGSRALLYGIAAGEESHGKYLSDCEIKEEDIPTWMTNEGGKLWQQQIWDQLADQLERIEPGCVSKTLGEQGVKV